jgi:hypothetical protein
MDGCMTEYARSIDVVGNVVLQRLAEQVRKTRQPVPLTQNGEVLAVVRPAPRRAARRSASSKAPPIPRTDPIFRIIGLGSSGDTTDVSEHVDDYLAQAYYEESHPPQQ